MGIQDIILKNAEEFARVIAALMKSKAGLHYDQALLLIEEKRDAKLWASMQQDPFPVDEQKLDVMEFLIRLRYQELEIMELKGQNVSEERLQLKEIIEKFTRLHPENYYLELEGMKMQLS